MIEKSSNIVAAGADSEIEENVECADASSPFEQIVNKLIIGRSYHLLFEFNYFLISKPYETSSNTSVSENLTSL